jgi:beta-phosphoglucomutase-like phosphatase (HAD superfamily)
MAIKAMIFDLDGTLVQTEKLKALSYAQAVIDLCPQQVKQEEVIEAFKEVVGLSRNEVARFLMKRFDLETSAQVRMAEFGVSAAWQAFIQIRLRYYETLLADPEIIRNNTWPHNLALLEDARKTGCKIALATMSYCTQAQRILQILGLSSAFDFVASRDDVEHGKPDPEIYRLAAAQLAVPASECLVIEDSPTGVRAALAAGMACIAVTTPFTRQAIHRQQLLEARWVVDDAQQLRRVVGMFMEENNRIH